MFKMDIDDVPPVPQAKTDFGWRQKVVSVVALITIGIWVSLPFGSEYAFSDFGIVAFLPIVIFYGSTILPPSRLADLPWDIILLLMGGNGLSKIVSESGLMRVIENLMQNALGHMALWPSLLVVNLCVLVIDFFLTHTVSSMITEPIVCAFSALSGHMPLYAMLACMTTTASQILPVSSFPNICASTLVDDSGRQYVKTSDVIKWGITITIVSFTSVMTVYFGLGLAYGM
jgi:di/tricarboxylate transporter